MRTFLMPLLLLAACNRGPEVPTAEENRDLDEAANMLDSADKALAGTNGIELAPAEGANDVSQ